MTSKCTNVQIQTWIPGTKVESGAREPCETEAEKDHLGEILGPAQMFIWLPILVATLLGGGLCFGCYKNKQRKRLAMAQQFRRQDTGGVIEGTRASSLYCF